MWSSGELLFLKYSRTELKSTGSACLILKSKTGNFLEGRMMQRVEKFHTWPHVTGHPQGILQVLCLKLCSGCVNEICEKQVKCTFKFDSHPHDISSCRYKHSTIQSSLKFETFLGSSILGKKRDSVGGRKNSERALRQPGWPSSSELRTY